MRAWLLTTTTYGTWLPGGERGSVTSVRDSRAGNESAPTRREHDYPGDPCEGPMPGLWRSAESLLKAPPVWLDAPQANVILAQLRETAAYRGWTLEAAAVMANHLHLVVQAPDDPDPTRMLIDFKAYASRALNRAFGSPPSGKWWTANGSTRKLVDAAAVAAAVYYVLHKQPNPLATCPPPCEPAAESPTGSPNVPPAASPAGVARRFGEP